MDEMVMRFPGAKDAYETRKLVFISSRPDEMLKTISGELVDVDGRRLTDSYLLGMSVGALMLLGHHENGNQFFADACREVKKNPVFQDGGIYPF
jgi:hypothetical protein